MDIEKKILSWMDVRELSLRFVETLDSIPELERKKGHAGLRIYGIPRGGDILARAVLCSDFSHRFSIVDDPREADLIVDDLIDSGATMRSYSEKYPKAICMGLIDKALPVWEGKWIVFPWEESGDQEILKDNEDCVRRIIELCGDNPSREGMIETPKRFLKAMVELTSGLREDPREHLVKRFPLGDVEGVGSYDEMILSRDIPFVSLCEHHLMPFYGTASIAYIPGKGDSVVGLSKLARLLDGYARRFQVQERLTQQVHDAIEGELKPKGAAVIIKSTHTCQCWRGVRKNGSMVTSAMSGAFRDNDSLARSEFLELLKL